MAQPQTLVTGQEKCWALGDEVLGLGMGHPALKAVTAEIAALEAALAEAKARSASLKRFGVGRTEDPALVVAHVVPALRSLGETAALVADQLQARLRRG